MRIRPSKHFAPKTNWINDPNGLIFHDGYYHLFFQYNPFGIKWGHMSWGHARSTDLINWEELPVAIPENDDHMIFSGSAIFDGEKLAAFYTAHKEGNQSQYVTFSTDSGITWSGAKKVLDLQMEDFRDPKVFRYVDRWIMLVAKSKELKLSFFESIDLFNWEFLSDYSMTGVNILYECPDIFKIEDKWVLILNTNPGGPVGGSGTHYVIGDFDGKRFIESDQPDYLDYGPDFYAAVTFNDAPERIAIAWMNNWDYAQEIPREGWNGSMTTARKLTLQDGKLKQEFIGQVESFNVPTNNNFQFEYLNGAIKFIRSGEKLLVDRSELWPWGISKFEVPARGDFQVDALFDSGCLELDLGGVFVTCLLEVGPERPKFSAWPA